jgi:LAGLIDADG endonuclease
MYTFKGIPDPYWISGFISGDGSFHIAYDQSGNKPRVLARFGIHLHIRDLEILKSILTFFKVDKNISIRKNSASLQIAKFADLTEKIIPFFDQYTLLGTKSLDFEDFKQALRGCDIIKTKEHLTSPFLFKKILEIKSGMNLNRK